MEITSVQGNNASASSITLTGTTGTAAAASSKTDNTKEENAQNSTSTIDGSKLNIAGTQDTTLKELFAKKAALNAQLSQFEEDSKVDESIQGHADSRDSYKEAAGVNQNEVTRLYNQNQELKEANGVEDDSEEQKDLELLEKQADGKTPLTQDELDKIANMGPLTDYQQTALDNYKMASEFQNRADSAREQSVNESMTIDAIKLARLKDHPMLDTKQAAEDMLKQVDDEIQSTLVEKLKDKVNENLGIDPNEQTIPGAQQLIDQKKVTEEDVKGLAVDEKV